MNDPREANKQLAVKSIQDETDKLAAVTGKLTQTVKTDDIPDLRRLANIIRIVREAIEEKIA